MSHPFIADPHLRCIFPLERKMLSHVSDSFQSEHSESDCSRCESLNKSDVNSASAHTCIYFLSKYTEVDCRVHARDHR